MLSTTRSLYVRYYRYPCMDYIIFSGLGTAPVQTLCISYDIICQWIVNLRDQVKEFPPEIALHPSTTEILAVCPDFHINGHGKRCQSAFSLMRTQRVGRFCAEGIETGWAGVNPIVASSREMTHYARQELLIAHWSFWNWLKILGFRKSHP